MQTILVVLSVAVAVFFLLKKIYSFFMAKDTKCDGCTFSQLTETKK